MQQNAYDTEQRIMRAQAYMLMAVRQIPAETALHGVLFDAYLALGEHLDGRIAHNPYIDAVTHNRWPHEADADALRIIEYSLNEGEE